MFAIRLTSTPTGATLVLPAGSPIDDEEIVALLRTADEPHRSGAVQTLPRPLRTPAKILVVGCGDGDESGWRAAGSAVVRAVSGDEDIQIQLAAGMPAGAVRSLAEGLWFAGYRYRDAPGDARTGAVDLVVDDPDAYVQSLRAARAVATGSGWPVTSQTPRRR